MSAEEKQGRSGDLLFITVEHRVFAGDVLAVVERQNVVYRAPEPSPPGGGGGGPAEEGIVTIQAEPTQVKTFCRVCEPSCGLVAEVEGRVVIVGTSSASPLPEPQPVSTVRAIRRAAVPKERMGPSFQQMRPMARHHTG